MFGDCDTFRTTPLRSTYTEAGKQSRSATGVFVIFQFVCNATCPPGRGRGPHGKKAVPDHPLSHLCVPWLCWPLYVKKETPEDWVRMVYLVYMFEQQKNLHRRVVAEYDHAERDHELRNQQRAQYPRQTLPAIASEREHTSSHRMTWCADMLSSALLCKRLTVSYSNNTKGINCFIKIFK